MISSGQDPENHNQCGAQQHGSAVADSVPEKDARQSTQQGSAGVEVLDEDVRAVSGHHIPQNAAAASGNNAHEGQQDDAVNVGGLVSGLNSVHGEDAQSDGIEQQHQRFVEPGFPENPRPDGRQKHDDGCDDGYHQVYRILKGEGRIVPHNQISDDSAAHAGGESQNGDAENIHPLSDAQHGTGNGEGNGSHNLQKKQNIFHGKIPPQFNDLYFFKPSFHGLFF